MTPPPPSSPHSSLTELAGLFLRLGATAFGGPAAHVAMFHDEVVIRRKWITDQEFLDLLGATNLIPGPNSTEMAIHIGRLRGGVPGLAISGAAFILPAMGIVMALAWGYVRYGSSPQFGWLLYGIKPVLIAIILQALWGLSRKAIRGLLIAFLGAATVILYLFGVNPLLLLVVSALVALLTSPGIIQPNRLAQWAIPALTGLGSAALAEAPFRLSTLFLTFLKVGSVLYGSGYVLLAFLQADFVDRLGWLTDQQLLDAIAVGQVTPGPLFTTATFIGFVLGGFPGAVLATLGIFLPSFFFVALSGEFIPRLRSSALTGRMLDAVNAASLGLMLGVTVELGQAAIVDALTVIVMAVSALLLLRFKINSTWLILGGGLVGVISALLQ